MRLKILAREIDKVTATMESQSFGGLVRKCRQTLGMTIARMSQLVGMSPMRLRNLEIEFYKKIPRIDEVSAIAELFDLDIDMLYRKAKEHTEVCT